MRVVINQGVSEGGADSGEGVEGGVEVEAEVRLTEGDHPSSKPQSLPLQARFPHVLWTRP